MGALAVRRCRIGALFLALAFLHGASVGTALAQNAAETAFWNRVRDSTNANELRAYLEAYPNGAFADAARARLKQIEPAIVRPELPSGPTPGPRPGGGQGLTDPAVIREIQERLYNLNYDISVLNGQLTEETRSAIRDWQKNSKHEPTGELTQDELAELRNVRLPSTWGALAYAARGASAVCSNVPASVTASSSPPMRRPWRPARRGAGRGSRRRSCPRRRRCRRRARPRSRPRPCRAGRGAGTRRPRRPRAGRAATR